MGTEISDDFILEWLEANPGGVPYASFYELFSLTEADGYSRNVLRGVVGTLVRRGRIHKTDQGVYVLGASPKPVKAPVESVERDEEQAWHEYWKNWRGMPVLIVTAQEFRKALRVTYTPDYPGATAQQVPIFGPVKLWLSKDAPQGGDGFDARTVVIRGVACVSIDYKDGNGMVRQMRHDGLGGMHMNLFIMQWDVKE